MIPFLNDKDLERIVEAVAEAGATSAAFIVLRLPLEVRPLFEDWLRRHFPLKASHVLARVEDLHSRAATPSEFGERMRGSGNYSDLLRKRFRLACKRFNLKIGEQKPRESCYLHVLPAVAQGDLFEGKKQ